MRETLTGFEKKMQRFLNARLYILQERSMLVNKMRLWKINGSTIIHELPEYEKRLKNYTHVKIEGVCLNAMEDVVKANTLIEDLPIS